MKSADPWRPTSKEFIQNPYSKYRELRKMSQVFRANTGDFVVMGYQDCKRVLQDPSFITGLRSAWIEKMASESALRGDSLQHIKEAISGMLIQTNPPKHQKIRGGLAKTWPSIDELRKIAEEVTLQVLSELPSKFDAISHICRRIPLRIISNLLALPEKEVENYALDGINLAQVLGPYLSYRDIQLISKSTTRLQSFLDKCIFSDDYVPTKLTENVIKDYPKKEMINLLLFIFIAGYETTSSLLAQCIYHLVKNKEHASKIEEYGAAIFVSEILRLSSPVQITGRTNTEAVKLNGLHIPKNSALTVCIGAANVDPAQFDRPEELVWDRTRREHLSFGYGMHFCLGSQLAEVEAEVLIEKLLPDLDKIQMVREPVLRNQYTIKSYSSFELAYK